MPIYVLDGIAPEFEDRASNWVAPDASVIGKVTLARDASVWFGAVLRGDNERITIGAGSNLQEHCLLHTDMGFPLVVGKGCTVGHRAILHGCTIGDNSLVGMGAIILTGARIGRNCLVAAGALVAEGREFPDNSLIMGAPARVARTLDETAIESLSGSAQRYVANAARFRANCDLESNGR